MVLAANHPNMLLDVLLLAASTKRTLFLWHRRPDERRERLERWREELASELEAKRGEYEGLENLPSG